MQGTNHTGLWDTKLAWYSPSATLWICLHSFWPTRPWQIIEFLTTQVKLLEPSGCCTVVTYWPSTQPSIKKQVHPVEDITLTYGRVEFGADATPTRSRWMSNNNITQCHRQFELVGGSCSWSSSCSPRQWEPAPSKGLGPLDPRLSSPAEWEKKWYYSQRNWGSICCSLFSLQLTSHT